MENRSLIAWNPTDLVEIPKNVNTPSEIVEYGVATLSKRDVHAIVSGFKAGSYEMVSTFVWAKAAATLKKQVAALGMEFVGEMLRRPDLNDEANPTTSISDYEAISLAEDLGMVTATQGLRLKQSMQLVYHFTNLDQPASEDEQLHQEEAISILRTCITSILGKDKFEAAIKFAEFRNVLVERTLKAEDGDVSALMASPYFFLRTTLSTLIAKVKGAQGAQLEHAVGNAGVLIPLLWDRIKAQERWQIGQAYAEASAAGNRLAVAGLKKALISVHGFDFVPETLRSGTFAEAAAKVLSVHFADNNFYNEAGPMKVLASLGTTIPMPAFAKCMEATLAVWLGNYYGNAWTSESYAKTVLTGLRSTQWEYYLNECLPTDKTILDKLSYDDKPIKRWLSLAEFMPAATVKNKQVNDLLKAWGKPANADILAQVKRRAETMRQNVNL
jgi:hypothetical protein